MMPMLFWLLFGLFFFVGVGLIIIGIWLVARMYGKHAVEIYAECIEVDERNQFVEAYGGEFSSTVEFKGAKLPMYRYYYCGKEYISAPKLRSNRKKYHPVLGSCKIRINPDHPERIYSSERKYAAALLIGIGILYLVIIASSFAFMRTQIFFLP